MQCKSLRDSGKEIKNFDVAYFMVSIDSIKDNTAFAEQNDADFPILSDPGKEMPKAYGVLHEERGFAKRWTYYIDTEGKLVKLDKEVNPRTAGADLARTMGELGFPKK